MIRIRVRGSKGEELGIVETERGTRLFNAILESGIDILNKCPAKGTCGRCAVKFISGEPDTHTETEQKLIHKWIFKGDGPDMSQDGVRASCQIYATEDMELQVLYRESEHEIKRSDKEPSSTIVPDPIWKSGKPNRELPDGYTFPPKK